MTWTVLSVTVRAMQQTKPIWAKRIIEARGGLSQEAFAARVGVSVRTLGRWERGTHEPRYSGALKLSAATGKSAAFFLGEDPEEEAAAHALLKDLHAALGEAIAARTVEVPA